MDTLRNTERVWWYVQREFQDVLGRPIRDDEVVAIVLVVSALTQMLVDES